MAVLDGTLFSGESTGARLGFEKQLWQAADALRNNMDAAEYKHVVLGLIFLKYISDAFEEKHAQLQAEEEQGADPEDPDEYRAVHIFWVPPEARWSHLKAQAKQPTIGQIVDDAMAGIERDNPSLKGVLPKDFGRPGMDKARLGQLIDLVSNIGLGDKANRSKDVLGRVYEYFLSQFASAEGKKGGQFYTPAYVVRLLVEMLAPFQGRVYDPCCGSGGMFVQSEKFIEAHGGRIGQMSVYGQESNYTTWRLAKMNLAIRGIDAQIAHGDSFHNDRHPDLKADYVLANPPFNDSDWRGELLRNDRRWGYGVPPAGNANFAWVQHFLYHLAPTGIAGFVLANGSMSSNQSGEGEIRKNIIEADLVDCMVALPSHLFYSTYNQVCLWFLARDKKNGQLRDRRGQTLFIDVRNSGTMTDRTHRELTEKDIESIAKTYHAWRGDKGAGPYEDALGYCKSTNIDVIRKKHYVLTPGRYVGSEIGEDDSEPISETLGRLTGQLDYQIAQSRVMDNAIETRLIQMGLLGERTSFLDTQAPQVCEGDRIELNRRMNITMGKLANAIFRSWFVNFDPTFAKTEGQDSGWPKFIADIFPDSFRESELGSIPASWRVSAYGEALSVSTARIGDDDAPEYSATVGGLVLREERFNKSLSTSRAKNKRITNGDIVFGLSRRVLNFGVMRETIGSVSPVYEVFNVNPNVCVPGYLEMYIRNNMSAHMDILRPGAREGQPIDRNYLLAKELLIPDIRLQWILQGLFSSRSEERGL